ncbi:MULTISPECIES: peroxide stress protein YaaA [unclassified Cupriavidus]|uniref:peroxide stress protein YaaA n=1 Tax=unclassified Cupriavidus TaxID=2640874 RepID=UPI00048EC62A|nr:MULTISPECIES: peroxide stress protein YaaA [unclassified Cupriavidus]MBP0628641.1 peroxide stress protein YaaA [Cupriavidus sp. AcVe19-1a]
MLIVLSPAKSLDYETPPRIKTHTLPRFIDRSATLIERLRKLAPQDVGALMDISDKLAVLNVTRYAEWSPEFTAANSKQAVLAFNGDVYDGLDAKTLTAEDLGFAQKHLRILSGLYGVLRPLDWMQPYRLEMGTRLDNAAGKDLYAFWGDDVTQMINGDMAALKQEGSQVLVNLASEEYFKVVRPKVLQARIVTPVFEDWKGGRYKIISFHAKRARGTMARYAVTHRITEPEKLKRFAEDGYAFDASASDAGRWVFRRRLED